MCILSLDSFPFLNIIIFIKVVTNLLLETFFILLSRFSVSNNSCYTLGCLHNNKIIFQDVITLKWLVKSSINFIIFAFFLVHPFNLKLPQISIMLYLFVFHIRPYIYYDIYRYPLIISWLKFKIWVINLLQIIFYNCID